MPTSSDGSTYKVPNNWIVVLGRCHGKRELNNVSEIRTLLRDLFGASRLVEHSGVLPVTRGVWSLRCAEWGWRLR